MAESFYNPRHEQVAKLAYQIWDQNGRPMGTAEKDWLLAEQILDLEDATKPPCASLSLEAREQ